MIKIETFDKEIEELCKEFSEKITPSEETAKFAEKLFPIIGDMQGQLKGLKTLLKDYEQEDGE